MRFSRPAQIVTRAVPKSFSRALQDAPDPIDVERARDQHARYVAALRETGVPVQLLPEEDTLPDSCFVEDPVVVLGQKALMCRSAAPSRAAEGQTLWPTLSAHCTMVPMSAQQTLDGGDVLRIGQHLYVGRSARTNRAGVTALRAAAAAEGLTVTDVPLLAGLHLKSVVTLAAPDLLVYQPGTVDIDHFRDVESLAVEEPAGANVLLIGEVVLVSASAPQTAERLAQRGCTVQVLCVDEFHKADGALTCLSIRVPQPGSWVT